MNGYQCDNVPQEESITIQVFTTVFPLFYKCLQLFFYCFASVTIVFFIVLHCFASVYNVLQVITTLCPLFYKCLQLFFHCFSLFCKCLQLLQVFSIVSHCFTSVYNCFTLFCKCLQCFISVYNCFTLFYKCLQLFVHCFICPFLAKINGCQCDNAP